MARRRKKPEAAPPGKYIRSAGGVPARLIKTSFRTDDDRWIYRLDFGDVSGNGRWTLDSLIKAGVKFLKRRPSDLPERTKV